jgi:hypothetical protein
VLLSPAFRLAGAIIYGWGLLLSIGLFFRVLPALALRDATLPIFNSPELTLVPGFVALLGIGSLVFGRQTTDRLSLMIFSGVVTFLMQWGFYAAISH